MNGNKFFDKNWARQGWKIVIPMTVFVSILLNRIPNTFSHFFAFYSPAAFILLLLLYYGTFQLTGPARWLTGLSLTLMIFGLTLSFFWNSGYSDDKIIGGLVPARDALRYYDGANNLLSGRLLPAASQQAAFRPLYPGFLSSLLLFTGNNLKWAMAIQVALLGMGCYLVAYLIFEIFGQVSATVFVVLLFFYIQSLIGYVYTESFGLFTGCLGFIITLSAIRSSNPWRLIPGIFILTIAISARAGAFFILPTLGLVAGWSFRGDRQFSWTSMLVTGITVVVSFLTVNTLFSRLTVAPGVLSFGTFAQMIYGQVTGGNGYSYAFRELGITNQNLMLREAWQFFLHHPLSFFIGAAKAYRDFLMPTLGIFSFQSGHPRFLLIDMVFWFIAHALTFWGIFIAMRKWKLPLYTLILASFLGIFLSIPFLPPIDGGNRFYASTMPFYFLPLAAILKDQSPKLEFEYGSPIIIQIAYFFSGIVVLFTILIPSMVLLTHQKQVTPAPHCPADQTPFAIKLHPDSYIDIIPDALDQCGLAPSICLSDFKANSAMYDPSDLKIYDKILEHSDSTTIRFFTTYELLSENLFFFKAFPRQLNYPPNTLISGCAIEHTNDRRPSILEIQTIVSP